MKKQIALLDHAKFKITKHQHYWISSTNIVLEELEKFKETTEVILSQQPVGDNYWFKFFAESVVKRCNLKVDNLRKYYDSLHRRPNSSCKLEIIESMLLSQGIMIDNTRIPCLPANLVNARDLVEVRAEDANEKLEDKEAEKMARTVLQLVECIILDPDNLESYQDKAPYDCLRPPKVSAIL